MTHFSSLVSLLCSALWCFSATAQPDPLNAKVERLLNLLMQRGSHAWTLEATSPLGTLHLDAMTRWDVQGTHYGHTGRFTLDGPLGSAEGTLQAAKEGLGASLVATLDKGRLETSFVETPDIHGTLDLQIPAFEMGQPLSAVLSGPDPLHLSVALETGALHLTALGMTITPLSLRLEATCTQNQWAGTWSVVGGARMVTLKGTWRAVPDADLFEISGKLSPITFHESSTQLKDLVTLEGEKQPTVEGTIELHGSLIWQKNTWTPDLTFFLKDVSARYDTLHLSGLNTALHIRSFWPLITDGLQTITCQRLDAHIPLHHLDVRFESTPHAFRLEKARAGIDLGNVDIAPFKTPWTVPDFRTTLTLHNVPVQPVIDVLEIEGLDIRGRITGTLPLHVQNTDVAIEQGKLMAVEAGTLRYQPPGSEKTLQELDPDNVKVPDDPLELVNLALQDFRYSQFGFIINKPLGGETLAEIALDGFNPVLLKGYPFQFRVNISGPLEDVLKSALLSLGYVPLASTLLDSSLQEPRAD